MTLSGLTANSSFSGSQYALYIDVDVTATATWANWDNNASVVLNGTSKQADGWCFSGTNVLYVQVSTTEEANPLTIAKGTQLTINNTLYEIAEDFSVYYYDGGLHTEPEVETTKVTITGFSEDSGVSTHTDGYLYSLYLKTDITGIETYWSNWDNAATLYINGTEAYTGDAVWSSDGVLFLQDVISTDVTVETITIKAGTIYTINSVVYEITADYTVYNYDGDLHSEAKVEAIPMTLSGLTTDAKFESGVYKLYFNVDVTSTTTWKWDNNASVVLNGVSTKADGFCFGGTSVLYVQVTTTEEANPLTIAKGTQFTLDNTLYEIAEDFNVYYYDGALHTTPAPTEVTLTSFSDDSAVATHEGGYLYSLYLTTDITGIDSSICWNVWDNAVKLYINGTEEYTGDVTWSNTNGVIYFQDVISADVTVDTITLKAGTTFTLGDTVYEIAADFTVYNYDGDLHAEEKEEPVGNTMVTITGVTVSDITYGTINFKTDIVGDTHYKYCDNFPFLYNGEAKSIPFGWVADNTMQTYNFKNWTEGDVLMIQAGTVFSVNDSTVVYEIANDYTVYYYGGEWHSTFAYKLTTTIGSETVSEYVNGDYVLPEFTVSGCISLGWEVDGGLQEIGTTLTEPTEFTEISVTAVYADFAQLDGASVKIGDDVNGSGIRFTARLGEKNDFVLSIGVLVMPKDLMTNGDFVRENYVEDQDYLEFLAETSTLELSDFQDYGEAYYLKGSVTKLFAANYTRTFAGRAFMIVNYADGAKCIYADYDERVYERRICDVAKSALEDTTKTYTQSEKDVLLSYAKNADSLTSFAWFGPTSTSDYANYAALNMDVLWMDHVAYHDLDRYGLRTEEKEAEAYNNPAAEKLDLKSAMAAAKEEGLKVIVYDVAILRLSECDIPLIATDASNPQLLGVMLQTGDSSTAEVHGSSIDESKFDEDNRTYEYDGCTYAGENLAHVINYVYQFEDEAALKEYVSALMSSYAQESNFYGVMLDDEPSSDTYAQVALMKKVIAELYPNAYAQSCQYPWYNFSTFSEWKTAISTYVAQNDYIGSIGVDFYPFLVENGSWWDKLFGGEEGVTIRSNYLASMQYLATVAQENDLVFEHTLQSHGKSDAYSNVTTDQLNLQVHLALAFGADRIGYYTYNNDTSGLSQYISDDTTLAAAVTSANTWGDYLKKNMTFFEYSQTKIYGKTSDCLDTSNLTVASSLTNEIISSASASLLVNEFYNAMTGEYGYYLVNITDPTNSTSVTVSLTGSYTVYQNTASASLSSVTLAAGEGVFIALN